LKNRDEVYKKAKAANPNRWSTNTRNWNRIEKVALNPGKQKIGVTNEKKRAAA